MNENKENTPRIRFHGFTDAWEQRELGEVIDNQYNGQTPSRANSSFWNGDINWLSSGELNRGVVSKTIEKITENGRKNANLKIVPKGTFVMAITGLEAAGTRGNCAKLGIDTTLNQSCMALYPNEKLLNSSFLFQWYRKVGEEYGLQYTQGTKQQSYNAELIKKLPIILPSVSEQKLIADFFDTLDHLITLHQRKLNNVKNLKAGLLQKMFPKNGEDFPEIRFPGFTDAWEQRKVSEITIHHNSGVYIKKENYGEGTNIIGVGNMYDSDIIDGKIYRLAPVKDDKFILNENDLIYGESSLVPEGIARVMCVDENGSGTAFAWHTRRFKIDNEVANSHFITLLLNYNKSVRQYLMNVSTQTALTGITTEGFFGAMIMFPNIIEQKRISNFFKQLDNLITLHQHKLEHLQEQKKALLQQMFI
ncbi:hypothetical protein G7L40_04165 [Paenibacillus polymyxa]|uniref:Restriction modification system DNA specificity domain-containing protein n=1 Tax=Paenibacillus polymyxa TaxID=1406 RepID=A0A378XU37_PAEPO|nr:restriction endonuclease subunit S [Paenibacillus polymyxa]MBE7897599.1 restriction endonuclease subunit S [Paenibacillus polymyxa]MBG9764143.1 hypothetical protein [Paenibacillus polymyxa]MCC3260520.1 restriction endonuclease subunit S [Paenibacillus polymyxa]QPK51998.1 hypothetical protein G7035_04160 [Paenibacillus polymyxa]QPK57082.1 hypothetical protein G7L40_04165 [Paenibacillus polymyxa]